jgi:hypothetical protein
MRKIFLQLTCVLLLVAAPILFAQGGIFAGKVTNAQGHAVPNAAVTLTNAATNAQVKVLTGPDGGFAFNGVPPGNYHLDVETQGYKHATQHNLVLPPGGPTPYHITLQAGSMNETVEIRGNAPAVQTAGGEVTLGIDTRSVHEIPVIDRNYQQLVGLQSGITPPVTLLGQTTDPERNRFFSANGQAVWNNQWMMDGVWNTEPFRNTAIRVQPEEAIQQLNIVSSTFNARRGFIGGSDDTTIIPAGTNAFHGTLFEFWNGTKLNARNFFNQEDNFTRPRFTYNQFGAAGGGAISKDKTFLFGSYQGMYANGQQTQMTTVPTAAMVGGNFSAVPGLTLYNPASGIGGAGRTPFPGNIIPGFMLSPVASAIASFYPTPNLSGFVNNYMANVPLENHQQKADAKLDQHFNERTNMYLRYGYSNDWVQQSSILGSVIGAGTTGRLLAQNAMIDVTHSVNANLIGDFSFDYNRFDQHINPINAQSALGASLGLPNFANNLMGMNISGFAPIGAPAWAPEHAVDNTFNWVAALSWHNGKNDVKVGADYRRIRADGFTDSFLNSQFGPNGTAYFGPGTTLTSTAVPGFGPNSVAYNSFAAFLLGAPTQLGVSNYFTTPTIRQSVYGIWLADTFHPFRNLTVELGARYENYGALEPRSAGGAAIFDPLTNSFSYVGVGGVTDEQGHYDSIALAPRIGVAYRFSSKTVIRGGYSIHYFQPPYALTGYMPSAFGAVSGVQGGFTRGLVGPLLPTLPNPVPTTPLTNGTSAGQLPASVVPLNVSNPYVQSFNIAVQREFYWGSVLSVGYVGALGRDLPFIEQLNTGLPGTGLLGLPLLGTGRTASTLLYDNGVSSNYNSLQINLNKRFAKGFSFITSYTYSHALGYTNSNNQLLNPFDFRSNYGPLDTDQRSVYTAGWLWEMPWGRGTKNWTAHLLGGWQLNGFFTYSSGTPVNVTSDPLFCGCLNSTPFANFFGSAFSNNGTQILNPASFSTPVNSFGNIGRVGFYAPGFSQLDLSLFKNFHVRDRYTVQLRGEAFNLANDTRFSQPVSNVSLADFGQQTSTVPGAYNNWGRQINVALRLMF